MKKVLRYFTDDALTMFKNNREDFCEMMQEHPNDTDWLTVFYGKDPTVPSKYEFDFEFKPYDKNSVVEDYDNAIALYELFEDNNIGPAIIYNEKFLTGFVFTFGYQYFMNVIGADKVSHVFGTLFFDNDPHRSVARNTIGRLYRYVELTVDDSKADRYELTKFLFQNKALQRIRYYTFMDGEISHRAFLQAFKEWVDETHKDITVNMFDKARMHLSVLANVNEIDLMQEREVVNYIKTYIKKIEHGID